MKPSGIRLLGLLALWLSLSSDAPAQEISAANSARALGDGQWRWTVYIAARPSVLDRISCVEYTLHETFKQPVQEICKRESDATPFPYTATGWGTFRIRIKVTMSNGEIISLTHQLMFEAPAPTDRPIKLTNIAERSGPRQWKWTAYLEAPDDVLNKISCVEYMLHPTFPNPVQQACAMGSRDRAFAITEVGWGAFNLKARVVYKDGTVAELERFLDFAAAP